MTVDYGKVLPSSDELFIGLVRAVGTDLNSIVHQIRTLLISECGYEVKTIKLSDLLDGVPGVEPFPDNENRYQRYISHMNAGDEARKRSQNYLALLGITEISKRRDLECEVGSNEDHSRVAWVIDSLMHPSEAATFRSAYGPQFLLIGVYQEPSARLTNLRQSLSTSANELEINLDDIVKEIISRDRGQGAGEFGLSIEHTFYLSDVFVDVADPMSSRRITAAEERDPGGVLIAPSEPVTGLTNWTLRRFFELIFGARNATPTRHEMAMAHAAGAALGSGSLARRVGAALVAPNNEVVAVGWNDVPAIGGGLYPVFDTGLREVLDNRDHVFRPDLPLARQAEEGYGYDANDMIKYEIFDEVIQQLRAAKLIRSKQNAWELIHKYPELKELQLFDVIEYGRSVHAEMAAILSAARRGVSPEGLEIYVTTFPCHECARHIIAAGIRKVIYLEPYPKSRVKSLHYDAAVFEREEPMAGLESRPKTEFLPFIGIAPVRFLELYSWQKRKEGFGGTTFPPGRAIERGIGAILSNNSRPRWAGVDIYYDELAPSKILVSEMLLKQLLENLLEELEEI